MKLIEKQEHLVIEESLSSTAAFKPGEVIIGTFNGLNGQGEVLVDYAANPSKELLTAISTIPLLLEQKGRQVAMLFAEGDPVKPVIIGLIHSPLHEIIENFEVTPTASNRIEEQDKMAGDSNSNSVYLDGKRVVIEGKEEVVFKCGESSITLTKAGKILIRGKYLLTRSSGVNRIMGGSVQIN